MLHKICNKNLADDGNLLDGSPPGFEKTTKAILQRAPKYAKLGYVVIPCFTNYKHVGEWYKKLVQSEAAEGLKIVPFYGRTQGTCKLLAKTGSEIFSYIEPLFLCSYCPYRDSCDYQKQKEAIKDADIIPTVWQNLPAILSIIPSPRAIVILDDVDIIQLVWHSYRLEGEELRQLRHVLTYWDVEGSPYPTLHLALRAFLTNNVDNAVGLAATAAYKAELKQLEKAVVLQWEEFKQNSVCLRFFYTLYSCAKANRWEWYNNTFYWRDDMLKNVKRVEWLRAYPTSVQKYVFAQLGQYEEVTCKAKVNENAHVLQVVTGEYNRYSLQLNRKRLAEFVGYVAQAADYIDALNSFCDKQLKMHVIAPSSLLADPVFSVLRGRQSVKLDYHYSPTTFGTNDLLDYNISCVLGVLHCNPEKYESPPYREYLAKKWAEGQDLTAADLAREETAAAVKHTLERLRLTTAKEKKLAIVFSEIDIDDLPVKIKKVKLDRFIFEYLRELGWLTKDSIFNALAEIIEKKANGRFRKGKCITLSKVAHIAKETFKLFSLETWKKWAKEAAVLLKGVVEIEKVKHRVVFYVKKMGEYVTNVMLIDPDEEMLVKTLKGGGFKCERVWVLADSYPP